MSDIETTEVAATTPKKSTFLKDLGRGLKQVACVAWTVPAARGLVTTLLIRFGVPSTLVAIGVAVGDKLAG